MYKIILIVIVFLSLSQISYGQSAFGNMSSSGPGIGAGIANPQQAGMMATTAGEGYLNGTAREMTAYGDYLRSLGIYQNLHAEAYAKAIRNRSLMISERWKMQDAYRERRLSNRTVTNYGWRTLVSTDFGTSVRSIRESTERLNALYLESENVRNIRVMRSWKRSSTGLRKYSGGY